MRKNPYFDIIAGLSEGGEIKSKPKISLSKQSSPEGLIQTLLEDNDALYRLREENVNLSYKLATMEVEHYSQKLNYFLMGIPVGIGLWESIKIIVG